MFFLLLCACFNTKTTSKDSSSTTSNVPADSPSEQERKMQKSAEGRINAEKSIEAGELLILGFGEEMPEDTLDSKTGLPLGSMGCEISDEEELYVTAYNDTMKKWLKTHTPFPTDMIVEFSSSHPDINASYRITHSSIQIKHDAEWKTKPSLVSQRMKIGVLAQRSMQVRVPASVSKGGPTYFLSVQNGDKDWSISWSGDRNPPAQVQVTMESILAIK